MNKIKFLLILFSISGYLFAQSTLDSLISIAVEVSPMLKMIKSKERAAQSKIQINSNLPDPMLSVGIMSLPTGSFSFNEEPMTAKTVGLSQEFPFPGRLNAVENSAKKDVEIVQQEYYDQKNQIIKEVTQKYYELNYIRKAIDLTEESKKLMKNILDVVHSMYSVNEANQQNIFRVDLKLTEMTEEIAMLKGDENELLAALNSFLLRDPTTPIPAAEFLQFNFVDVTVEQLLAAASSNRPYLKGIKLAEEKENLNKKIAQYDFYPMFKIGAQYAFRGRIKDSQAPLDNMLSVMLDVSLPLNYGGKVTSMVEETEAMQQMYSEQYNTSIQMLNQEFGMIIAKISSLKKRIELVEKGSAIQAKQNLSSALTAYQVGKIDFMNVIEAATNLYDILKNLDRLKTDYLKQVAELEFLTGSKLTENSNLREINK